MGENAFATDHDGWVMFLSDRRVGVMPTAESPADRQLGCGLLPRAIFLPPCNPQLQVNHENIFKMLLASTSTAGNAGKDEALL